MAKKEIKHINLKEIKNPEFLKDMSYKELDVLSEDIRQYLIETISKTGGHLSSNLGVVETVISLCKNFDFTKDKIIMKSLEKIKTVKLETKGLISGREKQR